MVILLSGLPASGKTTTAERLHATLGGVLIRQCDVYQRLGIDLRAWVRRTHGFTRDTEEYVRLRDEAYAAMREELATALGAGAELAIVDAVYGESEKRRAVYETCATHRHPALVVWCRCDDSNEVRRRFAARAGRDEPEHEADDFSIYRNLRSLWTPPVDDRLPDGTPVPVVVYDTGIVNRTVVPCPSVLSIVSSPPCAMTRCLTIASPSPVPPSSRDRALSTR
jgi:predicted kinase